MGGLYGTGPAGQLERSHLCLPAPPAALLIYALGTRPPWRAPNEHFRVCVATAAGPVLQPLATLDPTATLCTPPLTAFAGGDGLRLRTCSLSQPLL